MKNLFLNMAVLGPAKPDEFPRFLSACLQRLVHKQRLALVHEHPDQLKVFGPVVVQDEDAVNLIRKPFGRVNDLDSKVTRLGGVLFQFLL